MSILIPPPVPGNTTVIVRGIDPLWDNREINDIFQRSTINGMFDFLFAPAYHTREGYRGMGYAIINFKNGDLAVNGLLGLRAMHFVTGLSWARRQGFTSNFEAIRRASVNRRETALVVNPAVLPIIYQQDDEGNWAVTEFPPPDLPPASALGGRGRVLEVTAVHCTGAGMSAEDYYGDLSRMFKEFCLEGEIMTEIVLFPGHTSYAKFNTADVVQRILSPDCPADFKMVLRPGREVLLGDIKVTRAYRRPTHTRVEGEDGQVV